MNFSGQAERPTTSNTRIRHHTTPTPTHLHTYTPTHLHTYTYTALNTTTHTNTNTNTTSTTTSDHIPHILLLTLHDVTLHYTVGTTYAPNQNSTSLTGMATALPEKLPWQACLYMVVWVGGGGGVLEKKEFWCGWRWWWQTTYFIPHHK